MTEQIVKTLRDIPVDAMRRASLAYAIQVLRATGESGTESACLLLEQHIDELRDSSPSAFPDPYGDAGPDVVDWKHGSAFHKMPPPSEAALKIVQNGNLIRRGEVHVEGQIQTFPFSGDPNDVVRRIREAVIRPLVDALPVVVETGRTSYEGSRSMPPRTAGDAALADLESRAPTDVVITDELVREYRDAYAAEYSGNPPRYSPNCVTPTLDRYLAGSRDHVDVERVERCLRTWLHHDRSFHRG